MPLTEGTMSLLLDVARLAAAANIALLGMLAYVWGTNYRRHGASHTLALLVFAGFLLLQNLVWVYLYVFHNTFVGWFHQGDPTYQVSMTLLCGLQTAALVFLVRITWR